MSHTNQVLANFFRKGVPGAQTGVPNPGGRGGQTCRSFRRRNNRAVGRGGLGGGAPLDQWPGGLRVVDQWLGQSGSIQSEIGMVL